MALHTQGPVFEPQVAAASLAICSQHLHCAIGGAHEVLPCVGWRETSSQLDLPSLTTLSAAFCGRLQPGAHYWATSVVLLQVVNN